MFLYDDTIAPPQSWEVVKACRDLVASDGDLIPNGIASADYVYAQHASDTELPDKYIIVRERMDIGGRYQDTSGREVVPVQVLVAINMNLPNPHQFLAAVHKRVYESLVGQTPSLSLGEMAAPISREIVPSTPALADRPNTGAVSWYDENPTHWYSTATYYAPIKPTGY